MNTYINLFDTKSQYEVDRLSLDLPNVSLIEADNTLLYNAFFTTDKNKAAAGDIVYKSGDVIIYYNPKCPEVANLETENIIGIVVIEAAHTGDGTVRVVSLDYMDYNNPTTGSTTSIGMYWGDYTSLVPNFDAVDKVANYVTGTTTTTLSNNGKFPSNYNISAIPQGEWGFEISNCIDNPSYQYISRYYASWGGSAYTQIPCPYNIDGSINNVYFNTSGSILSQGLCGTDNTDKIMADVTHTGDIQNKYEAGYHPAAECCRAYKDGSWYLPSIAELGYLCANSKQIEFARTVLERDAIFIATRSIWSSSQYSSNNTWLLSAALTSVFASCNSNSKASSAIALAFKAL